MKRKLYKLRNLLISKLAHLLIMMLISSSIFAQAPQKMTYQAVIRNTSDALVTNTLVGMQISILQGTTLVYIETQTPTTNANGLVSIEIGGGTGFDTISWVYGPYFIKTDTDPNGGTTYSITGTSELLSVPYALHAKTAESISGGITETDPIFIASPANGILSTNIINWNTAFSWGNHASAGYLTTFTELDPAVTNNFNFTGATTNDLLQYNGTKWVKFTPNYLTTFTETDPTFVASPANGISSTNITNWNTAFGWGNHAGLYRPIGYVPAWNEITSNPFSFTASVNNQLIKYNSVSGKWENWTPNYLTSYTETQNIAQVLSNGNNANSNNLVNVNQITIGAATPTASTSLEINSTTGAFLLPRMTNVQRNLLTPTLGMMIYNLDEKRIQGYSYAHGSSVVAYSSVGLTESYVYDDGGNKDYPAQSFQSTSNVNIDTISFWVSALNNGFTSGLVTVNLYQGLPNAPITLLHSGSITVNSLGKYSIHISSSPLILANTNYYFEIVPTVPFTSGWFSVSRSNGATPGEHAGGTLWYYDSFMSSYSPSGIDDLKFEVVGPSETETMQWVDLH